MSIVMTAKEYTDRMIILGNHRPSVYKNSYPYNCLYVDGKGVLYGDCVNIQKCLLNGYNLANLNIAYSHMSVEEFHNTGDCTEYGLLAQCEDVSSDFGKLKEGEPRVLYMTGHIGGYLGKEVTDPYGHICNVVEATADKVIGSGILFSYIDRNGYRYAYKGGANSGRWLSHGKPSRWVDYKGEEDMTYQQGRMVEIFKNNIYLKVGSKGDAVKFLQEYLQYYGYYTGNIDSDFGSMTKSAVIAWQKAVGLYADGEVGVKSWSVIEKS